MPDVIPDEILDLMAGRFRMLSDSIRLAILRTLMMKGEQSVGQVVRQTGRSQANVSKHLKSLAEVGLIARRKEAPQTAQAEKTGVAAQKTSPARPSSSQ